MTLNIEHFSKTKLMRKLAERPDEDGYSVLADLPGQFSEISLMIRNGEIRCHENDRYSGGLARNYNGAYPAWGRCRADLVRRLHRLLPLLLA